MKLKRIQRMHEIEIADNKKDTVPQRRCVVCSSWFTLRSKKDMAKKSGWSCPRCMTARLFATNSMKAELYDGPKKKKAGGAKNPQGDAAAYPEA